jgi:hypothetical protein
MQLLVDSDEQPHTDKTMLRNVLLTQIITAVSRDQGMDKPEGTVGSEKTRQNETTYMLEFTILLSTCWG